MKRYAIALIAASALSTAFAQSPPARPDSAKFLEHLTIILDLDDAQKAQVKTVLDAERTKMEEQRAQFKASGERPTFEQMRAAHEAAKKETEEQLSSILTADQLKKFDALMAEHGPGGPPPGARGDSSSSSSSSSSNQ